MTWGTNDYPWRGDAPTASLDSWGYPVRECTSFAFFRVARDLCRAVGGDGTFRGQHFGNASAWPAAAAATGIIPVDGSPAPHCVFVLPPGVQGAGGDGHTGVVLSVRGSTVLVEDYNFSLRSGPYQYNQHTLSTSGAVFLHFAVGAPACPAGGPLPPSPTTPTAPVQAPSGWVEGGNYVATAQYPTGAVYRYHAGGLWHIQDAAVLAACPGTGSVTLTDAQFRTVPMKGTLEAGCTYVGSGPSGETLALAALLVGGVGVAAAAVVASRRGQVPDDAPRIGSGAGGGGFR